MTDISMQDRIEFALRDAEFDLDDAAMLAKRVIAVPAHSATLAHCIATHQYSDPARRGRMSVDVEDLLAMYNNIVYGHAVVEERA